MNKTKYTKVLKYLKKTLKVNLRNSKLAKTLANKSLAPTAILQSVFSALLTGNKSGTEFEKHHADLCSRTGQGRAVSRQTIGELLNEDRVVEFLEDSLGGIFQVAHNLRILKPASSLGGIVALIDGIDLGQCPKNHKPCGLCLKRKVGEEIRYYHRVVVISVMSKYGPLPVFYRFCKPDEVCSDPLNSSAESFKSDCELSCAKELLVQIALQYKGRLPFDVVASDALMANAPFMELVETLGAQGIFVFKQENRKLHKVAKADFTGESLGFNVQTKFWDKDPAGKGRVFESKSAVYVDVNRKNRNKEVKIFEITRTEKGGTKSKTMAIASNHGAITPRLVEEVRFAKWHDLENGVFNALTNLWGSLKHLFFHKDNALKAMLCIQFITFMLSAFYRLGNLRRGGRKFTGTVKDFFRHMSETLYATRRKTLIELRSNSP